MYTEKERAEQSRKKTYLAAVFVHTGVHDRKKKVEKLKEKLL